MSGWFLTPTTDWPGTRRWEYVGQFPTIPLHRKEFPIGTFLLKRVMDTTLSCLALIVGFPVFVAIAIAVKMSSPGPIFYRAQRIGRKGRTFVCYKFRTMVQNADKMKADLAHMNERDSVLFKIAKDPRITGIGRWLRKYSLDELPQFYNVLKGDMSLVGPRPPMASEVEQYDLAHLRRLDVLRGLRDYGRLRRGRTRRSTATSRWIRPTWRTGVCGWI